MTRTKTATRSGARREDRSASSHTVTGGYVFRDPALLTSALTHSSLLHEDPSLRSTDGTPSGFDNEQLEFLGDAVLSLAVAEALFRSFPQAREGDLTRLRASIVSSQHLAAVALKLDLGAHLRLGRGEDRSGGRRKPALLADAVESVIAAIYLDGGLPAAAAFIDRQIIQPALPELQKALDRGAAIGDFKSALQELLQATGQGQPRYVLTDESGPDHERIFRIAVELHVDGERTVLAESEGTTKKAAQQEAARLALLHLNAHGSTSAGQAASPEPGKLA